MIRPIVTALLLLPALVSATAEAGTLRVSPVRIELPADGRAEVLRVENRGSEATLVAIEVRAWGEEQDVESTLQLSEILAVPPLFEITPGALQVVRLALRTPLAGGTEKVYRLMVKEVPRHVGESEGISFPLRLALPVFATPEGAKPEAVWSLRRSALGPELVLANHGHARLGLRGLQLFAPGAAEPLLASDRKAFVLAGEERSWPLDLKSAAFDGPLTIKAETNLGPLEAVVALEGN